MITRKEITLGRRLRRYQSTKKELLIRKLTLSIVITKKTKLTTALLTITKQNTLKRMTMTYKQKKNESKKT